MRNVRRRSRLDGKEALSTPGVYRSLSATASSSSLERFIRRVASRSSGQAVVSKSLLQVEFFD
eukprot:767552-Hanusia_phi.AAC.2